MFSPCTYGCKQLLTLLENLEMFKTNRVINVYFKMVISKKKKTKILKFGQK